MKKVEKDVFSTEDGFFRFEAIAQPIYVLNLIVLIIIIIFCLFLFRTLSLIKHFNWKSIGIILKKRKRYSVVKEQGGVESPTVLLPKSSSWSQQLRILSKYKRFESVIVGALYYLTTHWLLSNSYLIPKTLCPLGSCYSPLI